jgi:hypothetical protein
MRPPRRHTMNYEYPRLFLDIQLAKRRCAQIFETPKDLDSNIAPAPVPRTALVLADQRPATKRQLPAQNPQRSYDDFCEPPRNQRSPNRSGRTNSDMGAFSFTLTLQLLGTIAAAHTDHPVFWLLVGPMPLAVGFTLITFVRQGFIPSNLFKKWSRGRNQS